MPASPNANEARPPITADTMAFASATSASGSLEVGKYLLFGNALGFHFSTRPPRETNVDAPLHVIGQLGLIPGDEEAGGKPITSDEDELA